MTARRRPWMRKGRDGTRVITLRGPAAEVLGYLVHCLALLWPGVKVPVFSEPEATGDLSVGRLREHLDLVIDEARAQLDRQHADLAELRARALAMSTVALTELGLLAATAGRFAHLSGWPLRAWIGCFVVVAFGLAGMGSIASTRADFSGISIPLLLTKDGDLRTVYAIELVGCLPLGQVTVDTRRTVFRDALALMIVGALAYGILWISVVNR